MNAHRLRAPSGDDSLLAEPSLAASGTLLDENRAQLNAWQYDVQGRTVGRLRVMARHEVVQRARAFVERHGFDVPRTLPADAPLIVTGHQPELFHPGVWVKNFAVAAIAEHSGGIGLNLIVDNDLNKATTIRVPEREPGGGLRVVRVEFDRSGGDVPFEDLNVADEERFASFGRRVDEVLAGSVRDPLIRRFWPMAVRRRAETRRLGERFALARREIEEAWGMKNLEVPLSALCESESFLWVAAHLLTHLPRYQQIHNDALARYRTLYGIRSTHHPVPALGTQGDWREAPFWVWRDSAPRRRPLMARQLARTIELRIDGETEPLLEIPLAPDREACCAVEQLRSLPARGVRLRTRALTTTMVARLVLGDLFVHGIGGAKYDELGDEIIRAFFGITPPDYLTLSMTMWLRLGGDSSTPADLAAVRRALRDLTYNPDRHLTNLDSDPRPWIEAKRRAIAAPQDTRRQRLERFQAIRRANEALQPYLGSQRQTLQEEEARVHASVQYGMIARSREYAFVLHSEAHLRAALAQIRAAVTAGRGTAEKKLREMGR